eukprot:COSAG01_NODE_4752_length_4767_cov_1.979006_1_plen_47_part_10
MIWLCASVWTFWQSVLIRFAILPVESARGKTQQRASAPPPRLFTRTA